MPALSVIFEHNLSIMGLAKLAELKQPDPSLIHSPSHPSFCLAVVEKKRGCKTNAGVGRTGNEANLTHAEITK